MTQAGARILLIEDDRFLRRGCEAALRKQGYAVSTAVDGEEGLRVARAELPDAILLDLFMPKMSGLEVLEALRAEEATRAIPVLVLSNSSQEAHMREVTRLGADYFVKSNLSLEELGNRLKAALEAPGPAAGRGSTPAGA